MLSLASMAGSAEGDALRGAFTVVRPGLERQLAMDAFAALPEGHSMVALLELDVSEPLERIAERQRAGESVTLFSFLVHAIAVAIAEHPDLNLVRHGRRMVQFEDVDVNIPVEVASMGGKVPRQIVIRGAQGKSPTQIHAELETRRDEYRRSGYLGDEDRWVYRMMGAFVWLPAFVRIGLMRLILKSGFRIRRRAGTTLVTSVGKFASMPGFAFTFSAGPRAATFVVGSVSAKPWVAGGAVVVRPIQALSIVFNHDLVDGAPAARFAERLRVLIESADALREPTPA